MISTSMNPFRTLASSIPQPSFWLGISIVLIVVLNSVVNATEPNATSSESSKRQAESTAIALNYCRASFHRIRKYPSQEVLEEEREKILNNLNLDGIADQEVIRLYSEVLDEVAEVPLMKRQKELYQKKYNRAFRKNIGFNILSLSLQVATAQYLSVIRTGADSWWDYRNSTWSKENEEVRLDKAHVESVVKKSSMFLDTFWKLSQKKNIPDRWLIRGEDLDKLEVAMQEQNPEIRLRILNRMQPFFECYPPYLYYKGRTQQQMGQLAAARKTYDQLANIGTGFFRRDEMLAASLANLAVIEHYQKQENAVETARESLKTAAGSWQVHLVCAKVLQDHKAYKDAEDAILRNLDSHLEHQQSVTALVMLYEKSGDKKKLIRFLSDKNVLQTIPAHVTIQSLMRLSVADRPALAMLYLKNSLVGVGYRNYGADDYVLQAPANWHLDQARIALRYGRTQAPPAQYNVNAQGQTEIRFRSFLDLGNSFGSKSKSEPVAMTLLYPGTDPIQFLMYEDDDNANQSGHRISKIYLKNQLIALNSVNDTPSAIITSVTPVQTKKIIVPKDEPITLPIIKVESLDSKPAKKEKKKSLSSKVMDFLRN